ncbi:hypothetical protein [Pseudoxanthomonas mexicana]
MKRQPYLGALESIQATTPDFIPPVQPRMRAASALCWLLVAFLIVLTLAAAGGRWS